MSSVINAEVLVCRVDDLRPGDRRSVNMGRDDKGLPYQAIVFRMEDGRIIAYRNMCQHLPVPLDAGSKRFLTDDKQHIICRTHGATYRIGDGYCVSGPCEGRSLEPIDVCEHDGEIYVVRHDPDQANVS